MPVADTIREKLTAAFAPVALDVVDESARHAGHGGAVRDDGSRGETHFHVRIVSAAFENVSRVERQRRVHAALAEGKTKDFETTTLYQRVFALADQKAGRQLPPALVPRIKLGGPKIKRNLTTDWYAHRVDDRFKRCLNTQQ